MRGSSRRCRTARRASRGSAGSTPAAGCRCCAAAIEITVPLIRTPPSAKRAEPRAERRDRALVAPTRRECAADARPEIEGAGLRRGAKRAVHAHRRQDARRAVGRGFGGIAISLAARPLAGRIARLDRGRSPARRAAPRLGALRRRRGTSHIASIAMRGGHLARSGSPVTEHDRDLSNPESCQERPIGDLDLEHVALGADALEVDRLEHLAPDALEAAGQIVDRRPAGSSARTGRRRG